MRSRLYRVAALAGILVFMGAASAAPPQLKFRPAGTFKILAISDLHYTPEPERHGLDLTRKLIALEKPDMVIVDGDCISGDRCFNAADIRRAIGNVAAAMEEAKVPWAVVLGNHDQDHFAATQIPKDQVMAWYEAFPYNVNGGWTRGLHGAGNKSVLVWDQGGLKPVFNVWLVDSGDHTADKEDDYDWIHVDQVYWYFQTSKDLEARYGRKAPGLMFFHIPIPEFQKMVMQKKVIGERHEPECPSRVNGGMFAAVRDRGDVLGIFCGHDHVNNYAGLWKGVVLGYTGVAGFRGYPHTPPEDASNGRARGGACS